MGDYIKEIREMVGSRPLIMVGACVAVIDNHGRLLLHLRSDNGAWGLPGGMMEPGEALEDTAVREVFEEVGLVCREPELVRIYSGPDFHYIYPNGHEVHNVTAAFICRNYSGELRVDTEEGRDAVFFAPTGIPDNISPPVSPIIRDIVGILASPRSGADPVRDTRDRILA